MGNWNSDCLLSLFIHFTFSLYSDHQGLFFCPLNSINTSFTCLPAGCPALLFLSHLIHADLYGLLLPSVRLICPLIHSSILFFQSWVREMCGKLILKKYSECRKEKKPEKKLAHTVTFVQVASCWIKYANGLHADFLAVLSTFLLQFYSRLFQCHSHTESPCITQNLTSTYRHHSLSLPDKLSPTCRPTHTLSNMIPATTSTWKSPRDRRGRAFFFFFYFKNIHSIHHRHRRSCCLPS